MQKINDHVAPFASLTSRCQDIGSWPPPAIAGGAVWRSDPPRRDTPTDDDSSARVRLVSLVRSKGTPTAHIRRRRPGRAARPASRIASEHDANMDVCTDTHVARWKWECVSVRRGPCCVGCLPPSFLIDVSRRHETRNGERGVCGHDVTRRVSAVLFRWAFSPSIASRCISQVAGNYAEGLCVRLTNGPATASLSKLVRIYDATLPCAHTPITTPRGRAYLASSNNSLRAAFTCSQGLGRK
jgi:hypothetical protein